MNGYQSGFANHFSTEAVPGALPIGRNSPQRPAYGLYAEQVSGTAFTAPRVENRKSWVYRLRPSAEHRPFVLRGEDVGAPGALSPNRLRWDPLPIPSAPVDFIDGLTLWASAGDTAAGAGIGIFLYAANSSMVRRAFYSADGEWLIVPQQGTLTIVTEFGRMDIAPNMIGLVPRGVKFRVEVDGPARGYVCENYGAPFRLPELGPIGANGLANVRDFETPVAWFEDDENPHELVQKFQNRYWTTTLDHSPFDVVAWHGTLAPVRYDLARFNTIGTISYDHPDPSIFTVLTSPTDTAGTANCDFVIFPPRWMVGEDTFRPPWFHRNLMSEYMGLITGAYDAKEGGFVPGGSSLHPAMSAHGPDVASHAKASAEALAPHKIDNTMAFMFESRWPIQPSAAALASPLLQKEYDACWTGFEKAKLP